MKRITEVVTIEKKRAAIKAWRTVWWTPSFSPAPIWRAAKTEKAIPKEYIRPLTSQMVELLAATAAVATAPSDPTMAESTYCTIVWKAWSRITGQANIQMILPGEREPSNRLRRFSLAKYRLL